MLAAVAVRRNRKKTNTAPPFTVPKVEAPHLGSNKTKIRKFIRLKFGATRINCIFASVYSVTGLQLNSTKLNCDCVLKSLRNEEPWNNEVFKEFNNSTEAEHLEFF